MIAKKEAKEVEKEEKEAQQTSGGSGFLLGMRLQGRSREWFLSRAVKPAAEGRKLTMTRRPKEEKEPNSERQQVNMS